MATTETGCKSIICAAVIYSYTNQMPDYLKLSVK